MLHFELNILLSVVPVVLGQVHVLEKTLMREIL